MTRLSIIATAIMVAVVSAPAHTAAPEAPALYATGPFSPRTATTSLSVHERTAFALLEGILQSVESYVHANGCPTTAVSLPLEVYSDAFGSPNIVGDASLGNAPDVFKLEAVADNAGSFRRQHLDVKQTALPVLHFINGKLTANYVGRMTYNSANNMMVGNMAVDTIGINGQLNSFTGYVVKDFYKGEDNRQSGGDNELFLILDWGLQFLSKESYPVEKYWQRSKVRRSDAGEGKTAFVKDRLVGVTKCRITAALSGFNQPDIFWQSGTLKISLVAPADPVPEFIAIPSPSP